MNNLYLGVFTTEKADYYNFIKENLKDVHVYGEGNFAIYGDMLRFDEHPHLPYFIPWNNEGYELYDDIMFKIVIYALPNNENIIMTRGLFKDNSIDYKDMVEMTCNKLFNEYLTNTVIMVVSEYTNGLENSMVNEISKICIRQGVKYRTVRDNDYGVFSELIKAMSRTDTSEV